MAIPWQAIMAGGQAGLGLLLGSRQPFGQSSAINQMNFMDQLIGTGLDTGLSYAGDAFTRLQDISNDPQGDEIRQFLQLLDSLPQNVLDVQGQAQENLANLGNLSNFLANNRTGPELGVAFDRIQDLFADPRFSNIVQDGGANARTDFVLGGAADLIRQGGRTPQLDLLSQLGTGLVQSGGSTPQLQQLLSGLQSQISRGGFTPEGRQLFGQLMSIVSGQSPGALLGMDVAVGDARNQAIRRAAQAGEAARRNAFQTGGAGAVVGSGAQNSLMSEFEDAAMTAEVSAVEQARASQQALQLQQLLGAAGTAGGLAESAQQTLSALFGTGGEFARAMAQNLATGGNLALGAEQEVGGRLKTGFDAATSTLDNELKRFSTAADAMIKAKLGGIEGLLGIATQDNNRQATALKGLTDLGGLNQDMLASLLKNLEFSRGEQSKILQGGQDRRLQAGQGLGTIGLGVLGTLIPPAVGNRYNPTSGGTFGQETGQALLGGGLQGISEWLKTIGSSKGGNV